MCKKFLLVIFEQRINPAENETREIDRIKIKHEYVIPAPFPKRIEVERQTGETRYENSMKSITGKICKPVLVERNATLMEWPLLESRRPSSRSFDRLSFPMDKNGRILLRFLGIKP